MKMKDIKIYDGGLVSLQDFKNYLIKCDVI